MRRKELLPTVVSIFLEDFLFLSFCTSEGYADKKQENENWVNLETIRNFKQKKI